MRNIFVVIIAATTLLAGCADYGRSGVRNDFRRYDFNRPDPAYGGYDASRYYRDGSARGERSLSQRDRVYRGSDDRYYCRRSDGSTGLIVGAIAGGVLGNVIARGGSKTLGTILGAGGGAIAGSAIDKRGTRCR